MRKIFEKGIPIPTINQLVRQPRKRKKTKDKTKALGGNPMVSGVVVATMVRKPRKPNSAQRKVARVRLSTGHIVTCMIPGEGHNIQEHHRVLVRGGRTPDLGLRYKIVRGTGDSLGVAERNQARSKYGTKKDK